MQKNININNNPNANVNEIFNWQLQQNAIAVE